jgi:futalosine hydrolase
MAAPTLVLVPTALERTRLEAAGGLGSAAGPVELCGFGPVAAAARAAALLGVRRPRRVLLLGIAGSLDPARAPLGTAREFGSVRLEGVGAGEAAALVGPGELGFPQWPGAAEGGPEVVDRIALRARSEDAAEALLTVCAASGDAEQATRRRARFPRAVAEDMEAFGVALACALEGVPLRVVRGLSNLAGDRDHSGWRVDEALAAALELARVALAEEEWPR